MQQPQPARAGVTSNRQSTAEIAIQERVNGNQMKHNHPDAAQPDDLESGTLASDFYAAGSTSARRKLGRAGLP